MVLMITVCKMLMIKMFYIFSDVKKINIYPWICHLSVLPTSSPGSCTHVPPSELPGLIYIPDLAQTEQTNHHKLYINCRFLYLLIYHFCMQSVILKRFQLKYIYVHDSCLWKTVMVINTKAYVPLFIYSTCVFIC